MTQTFIITGHGRSGTMFLATALNTSPTWTVAHEPRPLHGKGAASAWRLVAPRFARDRYGEVNSFLRKVAPEAEVDRKAVILRHPGEITTSFYNKRKRRGQDPRQDWSIFAVGFQYVDRCVQAGLPVIWFERLVSDVDYLREVAEWVGVDDAEITPKTIQTPINATRARARKAKCWQDCGPDIPDFYLRDVAWFEERYFGEDEEKRVGIPAQI